MIVKVDRIPCIKMFVDYLPTVTGLRQTPMYGIYVVQEAGYIF